MPRKRAASLSHDGVTAVKPLYESDKAGENQAQAKQILKAMRFDSDGYFFAYDSQGSIPYMRLSLN